MSTSKQITTLKALKKSGYKSLSVREEIRKNLIGKVRAKEELFPGIIGYDQTVIPQIENAILAGQDIILLGERGQAKSRLIRALVNLLDYEIPYIAGCEINDDPFSPLCIACRDKVNKNDVKIFSLNLLPRITRAQSMDVLSSQANLAGYKAVIE